MRRLANSPRFGLMSNTVRVSDQITVNGEARLWVNPMTVADLVAEMALDPRQVAIELNRTIIPRSQYANTAIHAGDAIEVVRFIGGG